MQEYKILGWDISEIKILMNLVSKREEKSLIEVFDNFAKQTNRKTFSVRNFYYKLLELANIDDKIAQVLNKNGIENAEIRTNHFSSTETENLLRILLNNEKNISVRRACMELAKGDDTLMMRYQNKYRNALKNQPELVSRILDELKSKQIRVREVEPNNIMVMPLAKQLITEKEIQSLFGGLIRLVKKSAEQEISTQLKREAEFANTALQNSLIDLRRKEILIKELQEQNLILKTKLASLKENLQHSQEKLIGNISTITQLAQSSKIDELKKFISKLKIEKSEQKE